MALHNGVIATRTFRLGPSGKRVKVSVGVPEPDPRGDWRCPYQISGLGARRVHYAYGIDAFQSLLLALVGIRAHLEPRRSQLEWDGGSLADAFPRVVPTHFGLAFSRRIERLIDREVGVLCRKLERNARKGPRARSGT
jgi:hypothetical protein